MNVSLPVALKIVNTPLPRDVCKTLNGALSYENCSLQWQSQVHLFNQLNLN